MRQIIAYPGTQGSFTGCAAEAFFPDDTCEPYESFPEAVQAVMDKKADFALLPVENSFAGSVQQTFSLLEKLPLHIVAETTRRIRHQLLALPGAKLENIRTISSHPQAIAQCDDFLSTLKNVSIIPSLNTAISAREVAESGDLSRAAIASEEAAARFGLQVLSRDIQTAQSNTTRFVVVSLDDRPLDRPDKATVVFTVNNRVGALVQVLISFAISGLNMSHLESRPKPDSPFEYAFIADFEGEMDLRHLENAMESARPYTNELRLLGVYHRANKG